MRDYLGPNPMYNDELFRRRFRVPKTLFNRICCEVATTDPWFLQQRDAAGKRGATKEQKTTAALRMLAYGIAADATNEYCRLAESTAMACMKRFAMAIVTTYESEYLRTPNDDDMSSILATNAARGLPGMLCSLDCMHWFWEKCPRAWAGQITGKDGKPSLVLEAVATQDLWIWHCFFGCVGSCNDINILARSPIFQDLYNGKAMCSAYEINGTSRTTPYYLVDGIYPDWTVFVKTLSSPDTAKKQYFTRVQEACRKDVERAFGVLQGRWHILAKPCKL
ncbi:hypothetical protein H257_01519 [Aphanomyces astaci]|uniref:DDE Tnp4 domain-containing protein n=1 Tax=Aphanomyces astaci TaxID=112090 RepID=W4HAS5_APHAT|nr:hypothetical protein H257_01519 [Aphanomyces astaci]ETV88213.1 hypothetical protein H257_01519 [Aphanomyces astaci]|eukprot:XP_009823076.1 hypothetical protein H257_01519 [Aphanomyces astaci]